jgi:hypothetical protein
VNEDQDRAPNLPPLTITITWVVGDTVIIEYENLQPWEVAAVLRLAAGQVEDEQYDTEDEEEDEEEE